MKTIQELFPIGEQFHVQAWVDVFSHQKLMGHADLQVLRRYLAQTTEDIAQAHRIGSPVDNNKL